MAYQLKQWFFGGAEDTGFDFMHPLGPVKAIRVSTLKDKGTAIIDGGVTFLNEGILYEPSGGSESFSPNNTYYVHCQIKRIGDAGKAETSMAHTFYAYLARVQKSDDGIYVFENDNGIVSQYVREVRIAGLANNEVPSKAEWVDVEFTFKPYAAFNALVFVLLRTTDDFIHPRYMKIAWVELATVHDTLHNSKSDFPGLATSEKLLKIGIQSRPNLWTMINGAEIRTSRSGIFEMKNGIIPVTEFSVIQAGKLKSSQQSALDSYKSSINSQWWLNRIWQDNAANKALLSRSFCDVDQALAETQYTRTIDPFILDYLYREKDA